MRKEADSLGEKAVPAKAYYGIQTARALENFHITGVPFRAYPHLVTSLAMVKKASAAANRELGVLEEEVASAIIQACDEIIGGQWLDRERAEKVLDPWNLIGPTSTRTE